jgi:predicted nucleic acid-binding protein
VTGHGLRTVVLDTEGLAATCRNEPYLRERLAAARRNEQRVVVPAIVLAEVMTGHASDARVWHVIGKLVAADVTNLIAARAGALRERAEAVRRKKRDLTVDAVVAAIAISLAPSVVFTADVDDVGLLTQGYDVTVLPAAP